MLLDNTNNKAA